MAIAHVQTLTPVTMTGNTTHTELVPSASTTAGNLLVVALVAQGNDVISSVDDTQGNTWTVGPTVANGTNEGLSIAYTVQDVAGLTGADTITAHHTTSPGRALTCDEFSGIDTTTPTTGSAGTATGTSTTPSATMAGATTDADALIFGAFGYNGTSAFTPNGSYTETNEVEVVNGSVHRKVETEYQIVGATSAYTADGTITSAVWTAAVMAFKAAAGGGGPTQFTQACDVSLTVNDTSKPYTTRVGRSTTIGVTASRTGLARKTLSATVGTAMAALRRTLAIRSTTAPTSATRDPNLIRATRSVSLPTTASLVRRTTKLLSGSLSVLATLATTLVGGGPTQYTQECLASISTSVSTSRLTRTLLSVALSLASSVTRLTRRLLSATLSAGASSSRMAGKLLAGTASVSTSLGRRTQKLLSGSLSLAASVATALSTVTAQYTQECVALIGTGVSILRQTRVARSASASLAASIRRRVGVAHSVSVALSASRRVRVQTVRSVSLAATASVSRLIRKTLSTTLGTLASIVRAVIVPPRNDPQEQSITVDTSLNSASIIGTANSPEVDVSLNSVRIISSTNTFEVTDG